MEERVYEFRWEWAAGDGEKRLFVGETRQEVLDKVARCLQEERGARPTQTIMRYVALLTRPVDDAKMPTRWAFRAPVVRRPA